jgi:hypothetical protein
MPDFLAQRHITIRDMLIAYSNVGVKNYSGPDINRLQAGLDGTLVAGCTLAFCTRNLGSGTHRLYRLCFSRQKC